MSHLHSLALPYARAVSNLLYRVKDTVKQVFLVHGEEKQAMTLKGILNERKLDNVHYPDLHDSVEL